MVRWGWIVVIWQFAACGFTAEGVTSATQGAPRFNPDRAFGHLLQQCTFGPRLPETPAMDQTRTYIRTHLEKCGFKVGLQEFSARSPLLGREVPGVNIYATHGTGPAKYMFSAHYDTRPFADQDPDPAKRREPVMGANDGASGVAVLLELAEAVHDAKLGKSVAFAFFDVEDHGAPADANGFCLGSRYMAAHMPPDLQFTYGINLDMVADNDLRLLMEGYSLAKTPKLVGDVWAVGKRRFPSVWIEEKGPSVYDDHMPFLGAGKAYIDVIDFSYPYWHTTGDTADKCSPQSLENVGVVALELIQN